MADRSVTTATVLGTWADQYNLLVTDVGNIDTLDSNFTSTNLVGVANELYSLTGSVSNASTLNSQPGSYYLDYTNFTNTPTIPTNNNQLANGAGYITGYTVTQGDVTQYQSNLTITESQISDLGAYSEVSTGTIAPSSTPTAAGDIFVNTTGDVVYVATGTTNSADWLQVSGSGNLTNLGDVTITSAATGDFLRYDGANWVDALISTSDVPNLATSKITSGTFADARISEASVTQHQLALQINQNQVTDLGTDLDAKAPLASPAFTGTPTAATAATSTSTTQIATTAFVQQELNSKDPTITLGGDLTGQATLTNLGSATLNATIASDAVALGTNTTGNYVATVAGTANEIEVIGSGSETAAVTIGLPNDVTVTGTLTAGDVHAPATVQASRTGNLQLADANKIVIASGNIVVTDDTFAQGDVIVIASSASTIISDDANLTLYSNGSAVTSVTLVANGSCGILFTGTNTAIITGNVS
jgi:hypothetical protein